MARPASRSRSPQKRQPSIRGLLIGDALRSWVPPTAAVAILGLTMLCDALELIRDTTAAAIAIIALLVLAAYIAVAPLLDEDAPRQVSPALVVGGALLWIVVVAYPFEARLFSGPPLRHLTLDAAAKGAVLIPAGEASRADVVIDAHLPLASDRRDRTVHYDLELVTDGAPSTHIDGELGDSWRMRRLGRRGTAPSHFEHLSSAHVVDVGSQTLRLGEVTLTGEHGATATATVYRHRVPPLAVLYGLGAVLFAAAVALDWWWDPTATATAAMMTVSACAAAIVFSESSGGHPGIRDVIGAALVGAVVGVPIGAAAAWCLRTFGPRTTGAARRGG